jgi:hypothetical protein
MADIFISYTGSDCDRHWAFWIGHYLEDLGHVPHVYEWELRGGDDIMAWMEKRLDAADDVLCVVSQKYLNGYESYASREGRAAQWAAASKRRNAVFAVFMEPCESPLLFAPLKQYDLHGICGNMRLSGCGSTPAGSAQRPPRRRRQTAGAARTAAT